MLLKDVLRKYNFPKQAIEAFLKSGITKLYPPQAEAIVKGVLERKNLLMSVPTAAGKTLIAELCMAQSVLARQGRCLYIVPLKALGSEKHEDFTARLKPLGIRVGIATGDLDSRGKNLNRYDILIATAEKVDSLLRSRARWLIDALDVVVLDEIHFLNDGARGPTLEILTTRIKQLNPNAQILGLSATVSNAETVAGWLKAELVKSSWRPIPLKEGVYFNESIQFQDEGYRLIREEVPDDLSKLVLDTLRGKGQVLVFVNSRRSAQAASRQVSASVATLLTPDEKKQLAPLARRLAGSKTDATKICRKLSEVVAHGAAFHHAGLKPDQRKLIEDNFKKNLIKVICSTPTLAAGVNLPARRAVIRDCKRFESGLGAAYIPVAEYKQCAGRAGRPQYDKYGEAVLIAKTLSESSVLFDRYIRSEPEPLISKLGSPAALRIHILASIAGGYVHDVHDMFDFLSHTFFAHQQQRARLIELIGTTFEFLEKNGFIEKSGFRFQPTPFGQCTSRLYIDPMSAIILKSGLEQTAAVVPSEVALLQLFCCCPDSPLLKVGKKDWDQLEGFAARHEDDWLMNQETLARMGDYLFYLSVMKTTLLFATWIEEATEDVVCETFNIGPGDVYRQVEAMTWLLHAGVVFAELFGMKNLSFQLAHLSSRVRYGIKKELVPLVQLKGVGRIRARVLFNKGHRRLRDLETLAVDDLSRIPQIGKTLAGEIKKQLPKLLNDVAQNA